MLLAHANMIYRLVYANKNKHDADDILREVFIRFAVILDSATRTHEGMVYKSYHKLFEYIPEKFWREE